MMLEPRNLNIPLYKRTWTRAWFVVASGAIGWLWHRPMNVPDAAVSIVVGGGLLWLAFASPFSQRLFQHHVPIVRGIWFVLSIVIVVWAMIVAVPHLHPL